VLAGFLRALGVPDSAIPAADTERAARYRTLLAGRRVLVVLDDAASAAQVRPLLPGSSGCAVIVTSRNTLPDLPGAAPLGLGGLDHDEARALFGAIVGPDRAAAEPAALDGVLAACAGLPLAVRIAASRLASRPGWSLAHLTARLADQARRLAELTVGDLAVRASFAVSYDALPADRAEPERVDTARLFRLLGLPAATVLGLPAIAALAGRAEPAVAAALEVLTDAHLIGSPAPDQFKLHDLLRSYAAELSAEADTPDERTAALRRLLGWYGGQAIAAAQVLEPGRNFPPAALTTQPFLAGSDPARALRWYEGELPGLLSAVRQAGQLGLHDVAAQLAIGMWPFFQRAAHLEDWLAVSRAGVASARHLDDDYLLSWLLAGLGAVCQQNDLFGEAQDCLTEALTIRRRTGNRPGQAAILNFLGMGMSRRDRFDEALEFLRPALDIYLELGDQANVRLVLNNTGHALRGLKRYDEAVAFLERAMAIAVEHGDRHDEGIVRSTLGDIYLDLGRHEEAAGQYRLALAALEETAPEHVDLADVLHGLGSALAGLGRPAEAREAWLAAIPILDRLGDPRADSLRARIADLDPGPAPADGTGLTC
jgi:tetratricopeptide (TPR) repeat protein